jgi:hypothetical protein
MRIRIRRRAPGAVFIHPVEPAPRTAVLSARFREARGLRAFPGGWCEEAARFAPESIAAPLEILRDLAAATGYLELRHPLVAFTYDPAHGITEQDRDLFWQAFGVPVFEQLLGARNELLATECDAHAGLHVVRGCHGLPVEEGACPCGGAAPRLLRHALLPRLEPVLA